MAKKFNVVDLIPDDYEPKRKFRWLLNIDGIDAFLMRATSRPCFKIIEGNKKFNPITNKLELIEKYKEE